MEPWDARPECTPRGLRPVVEDSAEVEDEKERATSPENEDVLDDFFLDLDLMRFYQSEIWIPECQGPQGTIVMKDDYFLDLDLWWFFSGSESWGPGGREPEPPMIPSGTEERMEDEFFMDLDLLAFDGSRSWAQEGQEPEPPMISSENENRGIPQGRFVMKLVHRPKIWKSSDLVVCQASTEFDQSAESPSSPSYPEDFDSDALLSWTPAAASAVSLEARDLIERERHEANMRLQSQFLAKSKSASTEQPILGKGSLSGVEEDQGSRLEPQDSKATPRAGTPLLSSGVETGYEDGEATPRAGTPFPGSGIEPEYDDSEATPRAEIPPPRSGFQPVQSEGATSGRGVDGPSNLSAPESARRKPKPKKQRRLVARKVEIFARLRNLHPHDPQQKAYRSQGSILTSAKMERSGATSLHDLERAKEDPLWEEAEAITRLHHVLIHETPRALSDDRLARALIDEEFALEVILRRTMFRKKNKQEARSPRSTES